MGAITYTKLFSRVNEKQPVFDFMIKKEDFYINTHGVSVTESNKSFTSYNDGLFYVLNKNNKPLYFNGLYLTSVKMRKERIYPANNIKIVLDSTTVTGNFMYEKYNLSFRNRQIGELTISRLAAYENNSNLLINPFQSIEFSATYNVVNLNNLDLQYFGKSKTNPDRKNGTIDINFTIKCFADKALTQQVNETLTITVNTVNSGLVPAVIQPPSNNNDTTLQNEVQISF